MRLQKQKKNEVIINNTWYNVIISNFWSPLFFFSLWFNFMYSYYHSVTQFRICCFCKTHTIHITQQQSKGFLFQNERSSSHFRLCHVAELLTLPLIRCGKNRKRKNAVKVDLLKFFKRLFLVLILEFSRIFLRNCYENCIPKTHTRSTRTKK